MPLPTRWIFVHCHYPTSVDIAAVLPSSKHPPPKAPGIKIDADSNFITHTKTQMFIAYAFFVTLSSRPASLSFCPAFSRYSYAFIARTLPVLVKFPTESQWLHKNGIQQKKNSISHPYKCRNKCVYTLSPFSPDMYIQFTEPLSGRHIEPSFFLLPITIGWAWNQLAENVP